MNKVKTSDLITPSGQTNEPLPDSVKADENANDQAVLRANDQEAAQNTHQDNGIKDNPKDNQDSPKKGGNAQTLIVALVLCLVCSVMVSVAAISMKPRQLTNIEIDRNKNILMAANIFDPAKHNNEDAKRLFENVQIRLINSKTGQFVSDEALQAAGISDVAAYDVAKASKDPKTNIDLGDDDPARVGALPQFLKVYLINDEQGKLKNVVLPINGYGLWGQIYGFLTLKSDINTIEGISFYQHKETPGLGALIEEAKWRTTWTDKQAFDEQGNITAGVVKSGAPKPNPNYVDGITGATITSVGVNNMVQFWLSDRAYKPFLDNLKNGKEQ